MCTKDDPQAIQDVAAKISMGNISTLGYIGAGVEPDVVLEDIPETEERSSHYLYPHEKKYLNDEKLRVAAHAIPVAYNELKELLKKGEDALPKDLKPIEKLPESGEYVRVCRKKQFSPHSKQYNSDRTKYTVCSYMS